MPDERAETLRRLRGDRSVRAFAKLLAESGLASRAVSRQRLMDLEQGADAPVALWEEIADALAATGVPLEELEPLRSFEGLIDPPPPSTADLRWRQWERITSRVPRNPWWHKPLSLVQKVLPKAEKATSYRELFDRYDKVREPMLEQAHLRLSRGSSGPFTPYPGDLARIDRAGSELHVRVEHGELFVLTLRLHNAGSVPWRDRMLLRLGPPVSSSLPLTPAVLPVPDTDPGELCEVVVPGRGQWFLNLAVMNYVMVFPDMSSCLPGRVTFQVDTRDKNHGFERSFELPTGFPTAPRTD
jgi:hypothetical protein